MREEDPGKLSELFEKYRMEYLKVRDEDGEGEGEATRTEVKVDANEAKRRRLQEIEDEAMREEEPGKLKELYEKYRLE